MDSHDDRLRSGPSGPPLPSACTPKFSDAVTLDNDAAFQVVEEAVLGLWDVVNGLTRLRPRRRSRYTVTIFGSARLEKDSSMYEGVRLLASELTQMGCDIVTGGGPGLMEAANEGSVLADPGNHTQSIGLRIDLDFEQHANPFVEELYTHRTFFSRLHHFVLLSDAFVVVPGGIGTTLEMLMVWQLLQVRKLNNTPLILIGKMWADLVQWGHKHMVNGEYPLAHPSDMTLPQCVDTFELAIALLRQSHAEWQRCHSLD